LVVWSTRHLPDELRPAGMLLALDAVWRDIDTPPLATRPPSSRPPSRRRRPAAPDPSTGPARRRLVVVDEAWTLLREGEGARFLFRLAKAARKRNAGLTVITQDVGDLLGSDLGQAVAANAATQILMRQAPQSIDAVAAAFALTAGKAQMLLTAGRGSALLVGGGGSRVAFRTVASPKEHALATTGLDADPSAFLSTGGDQL
jgi:DNA helicase HerA-like ATPase